MTKIHEIPLCYRKRPFGTASYDQFDMVDKGNMIDEETCHYMDISIKNYRYENLTLFPGQVLKCVGSAKFSCQKIINGKIGESIQFSGKVVRHLSKTLHTDAVSGHNLTEKLSNLPVLKPSKPQNKVKKWIEKHHGDPAKSSSSSEFQTAYPMGTPSFPSCKCDWSHKASSPKSKQCCAHRGLCDECEENLHDLRDDDLEIKQPEDQEDDQNYDEDDDEFSIVEKVIVANINPWERKYPVHKAPNLNYNDMSLDKQIAPADTAFLGHAASAYLEHLNKNTREDLPDDDCDKEAHGNDDEKLSEEEMRKIAMEHGYDDFAPNLSCNNANEDEDDDYDPGYDDYNDEYYTEEDIATAARFGYTLKNIHL